jgi:uncharacterized membrane protein YhaH (DUF805 family)
MHIVEILFSLEGRINRLQFWLALLAIAIVSSALFIAGRDVYAFGSQICRLAGVLLFCLVLFFFWWTIIAVSIKRWLDMNLSGFMTLLWLIPFVGPIIVILWLGFGPGKGTHHGRRYE